MAEHGGEKTLHICGFFWPNRFEAESIAISWDFFCCCKKTQMLGFLFASGWGKRRAVKETIFFMYGEIDHLDRNAG